MKNKIFLSSMLIMSVAPAMAEEFPSNGLMKENKTYDNAATSTNMDGVYEGSVNATAEYDTIDYILSAGKYLPADSETVTTCPAGSFCSGIGNVNYNQTTAQGIETCPSGFGNSASGSSVNTQCYRACDINNMGANGTIASIAHAASLTGNDYYGAGTDTCVPDTCVHGYHVKAAVTAPDLNTLIGTEYAAGYASNKSDGTEKSTLNMTYANTGISGDSLAFVVRYNEGIIKGHGRCSTRFATDSLVYDPDEDENIYELQSDNITSTLPDSTGQYCYCQLDGYTPYGGQSQSLSSPWVFIEDRGGADVCANVCAGACAANLRSGGAAELAFRAVVFGAVQSSPAMCEANTITINWSDASAADISANNAGTATYGSDVRTPVKATTKKGKTFKGWRFSKPEQTNL